MLEYFLIVSLIGTLASSASVPKPAASKREADDARHTSPYASFPLGVTDTLGSGAFSRLGIPGSLGNVYARNDYLPSPYYDYLPPYVGGFGDYRAQSYLNYGSPILNPYSGIGGVGGGALPGTLYGSNAGYPYYPRLGLLPRPPPLDAADAFYGRLSGYYY